MTSRFMASHRVATICGIEVRVAYALYIFILAILLFGVGGARQQSVVIVLFVYPWLSFAHEIAHGIVARRHGVDVRRIMLHPIGGVAELHGLLPSADAEIAIALAGPVTSLLLAALAYPGLCMEGITDPFMAAAGASTGIARWVGVSILVNSAIGLFNLLPIFPMDGGRVAMALTVKWLGPSRGVAAMARVALVGILLLVIAGCILAYLWDTRAGVALVLVATFLYTIGHQEIQARKHMARIRLDAKQEAVDNSMANELDDSAATSENEKKEDPEMPESK